MRRALVALLLVGCTFKDPIREPGRVPCTVQARAWCLAMQACLPADYDRSSMSSCIPTYTVACTDGASVSECYVNLLLDLARYECDSEFPPDPKRCERHGVRATMCPTGDSQDD